MSAHGQLQALLTELEAMRLHDREREQHFREMLPMAARLKEVPLIHGLRKRDDFIDILRARELRPGGTTRHAPLRPEEYLGLKDVVYSALGVLYPDMDFAIVFRPSVEAGTDAVASPWDSGSFCRSLCPKLPGMPDPTRREVFLKYTLPTPEFREYLVHYVASCYPSPVAYLYLQEHRYADPLGALMPHSWPSRIFEVRHQGPIPLQAANVEALFLPRHSGGTDSLQLHALARGAEKRGLHIEYYRGATQHLKFLVRDWVLKRCRLDKAMET